MNLFPVFPLHQGDWEQNNSCRIKGVPTVPSVPTPPRMYENRVMHVALKIPKVTPEPHWELGTGNKRTPANGTESKQKD